MSGLTYPLPHNEQERIAVLQDTHLLDSPEEEVFNGIIRTAKALFDMPIVIFSLVDINRQWFKAQCGLGVNETSREVSMCTHAILNTSVMVVADAREDVRFKDGPLVVGDPNIRFYAGAPIIIPDGIILGTLCIIDQKPHHDFDEEKQALLQDLAALIAHIIELRMTVQVQDS